MTLLLSGGIVSVILLAFGALATLLFLKRWLSLRLAGVNIDDLLNGITNLLNRNAADEALAQCDATGGPASKIIHAAITHRADAPDALREAMESAGHHEATRLERRLALLLSLAQTAPLLGLLGTLWGFFETLLVINANAQAAIAQSADLTAGVARALGATACGLVVAMLCHLFYNTLIVRVDRLILDMERAASHMFILFTKNAGGK